MCKYMSRCKYMSGGEKEGAYMWIAGHEKEFEWWLCVSDRGTIDI